MPPKRRGGTADTSKGAKRAKPAAKDTVGIPELFKKVKSDLTPDAKGQKPASQEPAHSPVVEDVAEPAPSTLTQPSTSAEPVATPPTPLTSEEDSLLRSFDLCEAYGPSLGLSRKERWQRAEGASPPGLHSAPRQRISSNRPLARACAALTGRLRTGAACERVDGPRAGGGQHARRGVGALAVRHPRECVRAWPGGAGGPLVQ